jgi:hypothetical protein
MSFSSGNLLLWDLLRGLLSFELELQQGHSLRRSYVYEDIDKYSECTRDEVQVWYEVTWNDYDMINMFSMVASDDYLS